MITEKDSTLLDYLLGGTNAGTIRWAPTAVDNQFTTSFKGKYNVVVTGGQQDYYLRMENDAGQIMLSVRDGEDNFNRVRDIFLGARRIGLDVDAAIDEITSGE